jgi:2-methylcitrate dehydratase PrpD
MDSITQNLARFCKKFSYGDLQKEVVEKAKFLILDAIGAQSAGSGRRETNSNIEYFSKLGGLPQSTLITSKLKIPMVNAAFANGEMNHDCGLDDLYPKSSLHPGSVVWPSAFSAADAYGVSGQELICAMVLGYEVMIRVADSIGPKVLYARGFHPTAIAGAFGSTMAVGKIMGLSEEKLIRALGIAASTAGGLMEFLSDGSTVKRLHSGFASHNGTLAAVLADMDFTGPYTAFEGKDGFFKAYANSPNISTLNDIGKDFCILQTGIKLFPATRYIEPSLNILTDLLMERKLDYKEIEKITVYIFDAAFPIVINPIEKKRRPVNDFAAQFSLPYNIAAMLVCGELTRKQYDDEAIHNKDILELTDKIDFVEDAELNKQYPAYWPTKLTIRLKNGETISKDIFTTKGDPANPATLDEEKEKFTQLATPVFGTSRVKQIIGTVMKLEELKNIHDLGNLLRRE